METILSVGQDVISIFSDALSALGTMANIGTAIVSGSTGTQTG